MHDPVTVHSRKRRGRLAGACVALGLTAALLNPATTAEPADAQEASIQGLVEVGGTLLADYDVTLYATGSGGPPSMLATTTTGALGAFSVSYTAPADEESVLYLLAENTAAPPAPGAITLASVLGPLPVAGDVVVNERTTVASGYALAQFTDNGTIAGTAPGLQNAAGMVQNMADVQSGGVSGVLGGSPNGGETTAINTFNSLANMLVACVEAPAECAGLFTLATSPGGSTPTDTFQAMVDLAANPGRSVSDVADLFLVSELGSTPNQPARTVPPAAWTIALRFNGDGQTLSGPGNFAIDHEGNLWVANNYDYNPDSSVPVCGSDLVMKFTPTGQYITGSPYSGGGLSGAGFGIDIDPYGDVWVGNYGFAAPPPGCPEDKQPPHNSVSKFSPDGTALSPAQGFTQGGVNWPQATVSDQLGNIWIANCTGETVTMFPDGNPLKAKELTGLGLTEPFGIAHNSSGDAFVTGIGSNNVAMLAPDGTPYPNSPIGGVFERPMGIAADSGGYMWVANSGLIELPCPTVDDLGTVGGSVALLSPEGDVISTTPFTGGGLTLPWGIALDGNDNVWVANFGGKRVSHFCGLNTATCPPGTSTGDPISPDVTGYAFDGLVRNTGVAIDQAGNVWLANNWKEIPLQTNPGGYEIVAYVGLAGPVDVPDPIDRPGPEPTPPPAPAPQPIAAQPTFTG